MSAGGTTPVFDVEGPLAAGEIRGRELEPGDPAENGARITPR